MRMKTRIQEIVTLTREGWRPYDAEPERAVYERLRCSHVLRGSRRKPFWFVRGDVFCCIGCADHCTLQRPAGFPLPLPIKYPGVPPDRPYMLTPQEMLARHDLLNVRQAAYCLNVSERQIYDYIAEGRLVKLRDNPVRVRAAEVKELREDFDE